MVEINWTALVILLIGLFALAGYYKGWWKEAITTVFLTFLVLLSQVPTLAQIFINTLNFIISLIWRALSALSLDLVSALETSLGLDINGETPQLDAGDGHTWIIILIIFLSLAILIGRHSLPGWSRPTYPYEGYVATQQAAMYGALLGGINGWLIISLVRVYLTGSTLPGGSSGIATSTDSVIVQATDVPLTSIADSFLPWLFAGLAILVLIAAVNNRVVYVKDKEGYRKIDYKPPLGYTKQDITLAKDK